MSASSAVKVLERATRPGFPAGMVVQTTLGDVFVRAVVQDVRAPTVLLVHGWSAWSDANWLPVYQPVLDAGWNLIAPDLPGHADGPRVDFSLERCADLCAEVCSLISPGPVVVCGYSMGGPVGLLIRDRYPDLVGGLVLAATSAWFHGGLRDEALFGAARVGLRAAGLAPGWLFTRVVGAVLGGTRKAVNSARWMLDDVAGHHWPTVLNAALDLARFDFRGRSLGGGRAAVVMTSLDATVPWQRQADLARAVGAERVIQIAADHSAPMSAPVLFASAIVDAVATLIGPLGAVEGEEVGMVPVSI